MKKLMSSLLVLSLVTPAFGDTYNFYFSKKKKNGEQSEETSETEAPRRRARRQAPVVEEGERGDVTIQNHNANNVNGNTLPNAGPVVTVPPTKQERAAETTESETDVAAMAKPHISQARLGVGGLAAKGGIFQKEDPGAILSLSYLPSPFVGLSVFGGGIVPSYSYYARSIVGVEAELYPFASASALNLPFLELGLIGGAYRIDQAKAELHAGLRLNMNLSNRFGLTAVARGAKDLMMAEVGIITRL